MNLNHLVTLAALAEAGSFVGAARRLRLPPSTVTGHIAALEAAVGAALVVRTTRKMRLTDLGAQLAADAAAVAAAADSARLRAARARSAPGGTLRLSLPAAFALDLFAPLIGGFLADNPGIALDLTVSNRRDDLIAEGIDLAVRVGPLTGNSMTARLLARAQTALYASASLPEPRDKAGLSALPFLGFAPDTLLDLTGPGGPETLRLAARMTANDPGVIARAVAAGAGAALLPAFLMAPHVAAGTVRRILPAYVTEPVDIHLIAHGPIRDTPAAARLADHLAAHLPRRL